MRRLTLFSLKRRKLVIGLWVALAFGLQAASGAVGPKFSTEFTLPGTDSQAAMDLLKKEFPDASGEADRIVWHVKSGTVLDPAVQSKIEPLLEQQIGHEDVSGVVSPYSPQGLAQVSSDKKTAYAILQYNKAATGLDTKKLKETIEAVESVNSESLTVAVGGMGVAQASGPGVDAKELTGLVFAGIVLFLMFRSRRGVTIPLGSAVISMVAAMSLVLISTKFISLNSVAPTITLLLGLGVGIDYALFIVHRTRKELLKGKSVEDAILTAMQTSGRAVIFAGITVAIALLGMLTLGMEILFGIGVAATLGVAVTVLSSMTLVPAMLMGAGLKILSKKQRAQLVSGEIETSDAPISRRVGWVARHPIAATVSSLLLLLSISAPVASIQLGMSDQGTDPKGSTSRVAYDLLKEGFGAGFNGPLVVAVDNAQDTGKVESLRSALESTNNVAQVSPAMPSPNGQVALLQVIPTTGPQDEKTTELLKTIREDIIPTVGVTAYVGGTTAVLEDFSSQMTAKIPMFFAFVLILSFILLVIAFRSIWVPLVGAALNVLSATAAFGAVVAVFQWGMGKQLLGIETGPIEPFIPVLAFAILFGLSMDYQVFLISRIREEWMKTGDSRKSISRGLQETGPVITAAALIMAFVFSGFILAEARSVKLNGFAMAVAVLMDAFIVRQYLVPGVLHLLGKKAWSFPKPLEKLLPKVKVD